ncbi:MAG: DUF222 domain-containing protein [Acidimicrobiales bacterium]
MFETWIAELSRMSPRDWPRSRLDSAVGDLGRLRGAIDAWEATILATIDALGDDGLDAETVVRSRQRCSRREASRRSRRAAALARMPRTAAALSEGRMDAEHVDTLVRAADDTSPEEVDGSRLVPADGPARPADLARRDIRDWSRAHQSAEDRHQAHRRRRAARELSIFVGDDEMVIITGRLDPVTGAEVRSVLDAETDRLWRLDGGRDTADEVRSVSQRRADALHGLLCCDSSEGTAGDDHDRDPVPARAPTRHQVIVVTSLSVIDGTDPDGHCEIPGSGAIPPSELERLACNSELAGLLFDGSGEVLWHGRRRRSVSDPQWRSLVARDRGCVLCDAVPSRCEAHHLTPWALGGRTDIGNLALLCVRCHHQLHDTHQTLHPPDPTNQDWHTSPGPRPTGPSP